MNRKAQIVGQVFIYMLSVILVAAILFYGYGAIKDFRERSKQVSLVKLQNDFSAAIDSLSSDFGSVKIRELDLEGFSQICLIESFSTPSLDGISANPILLDSVRSSTGKNVFLLTQSVEASFSVKPISVEPDILCIKARSNKASVRLEGKGDHVEVSPWQG